MFSKSVGVDKLKYILKIDVFDKSHTEKMKTVQRKQTTGEWLGKQKNQKNFINWL